MNPLIKIIPLSFLLTLSCNIFALDFSQLENLINHPDQIDLELKKMQHTEIPKENVYYQSHLIKIIKLQKIFGDKKIHRSVNELNELASNFKWKKIKLKTENLKSMCTYNQTTIDKCFDKIADIREFINIENVIQEKMEVFLQILEDLEDAVLEFSEIQLDFTTYFNEEVTALNATFYNSNEKILVSKKQPKSPKSFVIETNITTNEAIGYLSLITIILTIIFKLNWIKSILYPSIVAFYIKKKWLQNIQAYAHFKLTKDDLKILRPYAADIGKLATIVSKSMKNSKINIDSNNKQFIKIEFSYPYNSAILKVLDNENFQDIKNALLKIDSIISSKDQIQIIDQYEKNGHIALHLIQINFKKITTH